MTKLLEQLRADQLDARKDHDKVKAALLTTLIGEVTKSPPAKKLGKDDNGVDIYEKVETDLSDAKVIRTVKSFLENVKASLEAMKAEFTRVMGHPTTDMKTRLLSAEGADFMQRIVPKMHNAEYEIKVLEVYVPEQLTEAKLREIIGGLKAGGANMGAIMAHLKDNYAALYDGKLASQIAKES